MYPILVSSPHYLPTSIIPLGLLTSLSTHLVSLPHPYSVSLPHYLPTLSPSQVTHSPCTHPSGEPVLVGYGDFKNAPSLSECPTTSINDVCYLVKTLYPSSQKQVPYNQLYGWQLYVDNRVLPIQLNTPGCMIHYW